MPAARSKVPKGSASVALFFAILAAGVAAQPTGSATDGAVATDGHGGEPVYLYVWAGPDNTTLCRDALFTIDASPGSPNFGKIIRVTEVPTSGNEPHHLGLNQDATVVGAGGLLSVLRNQDEVYFFNVTDPSNPKLIKSANPPNSGCADEFRPAPGGGFFVTMMCSATGGAPGRVARFDANLDLVGEYPATPPPDFNPHGITVDVARGRMVTSDFIIPGSTLHPSDNVVFRSTFRVWDLNNMTIIHTGDLGAKEAMGIIDARLLNQSGMVVLSSGMGTLYGVDIMNPDRVQPIAYTGSNYTFHEMFAPFANGTRLLVTLLNTSQVLLYDASDPWHLKKLQEYQLPSGSDPHFVSLSPDERMAYVSAYFLDEGEEGLVHLKGTQVVHLFDVAPDGRSFSPNSKVSTIDFKTLPAAVTGMEGCGVWRPHGGVFKQGNRAGNSA